MIRELAAKRLQLLKEAVPGISRVMVLTYLVDPIAPLQVKAMTSGLRPHRWALHCRSRIHSGDDIPAAFRGCRQGGRSGAHRNRRDHLLYLPPPEWVSSQPGTDYGNVPYLDTSPRRGRLDGLWSSSSEVQGVSPATSKGS